MSKDLEVLRKVYEDFNEYKWSELEISDEIFRAIKFPGEAEKFIDSFVAYPTSHFAVIVGSYRSRYYNDEESYVWENKEYAAIVMQTLDKPFNSFFINDRTYDRETKPFLNLKNSIFSKKGNLVTNLYNDVSRKVSGLDEVYDSFLDNDD